MWTSQPPVAIPDDCSPACAYWAMRHWGGRSRPSVAKARASGKRCVTTPTCWPSLTPQNGRSSVPATTGNRRHITLARKKRHTRKTQIIVNEKGVIRDLSASTPGSVHDLEHFRRSGAAQRIPKEVTAGGDSGYQGLHKELPDHSVFVPHKARRNHPLTEDEKLANRELSRERAATLLSLSLCQPPPRCRGGAAGPIRPPARPPTRWGRRPAGHAG
ncbi:TPA: hypothetical protein EYP84_02155 [Candidatus Bipolaricaulota bacterium]|nr:hypothetical protein [Candidatus Bipolaricaulota bacterium]